MKVSYILTLILSSTQSRTVKDDQINSISPMMMNVNDVQIGLGDKGRRIFSRDNVNDVRYVSNLLEDDTANLVGREHEVSHEIDKMVFASSGELGEALRLVWESFDRRMKVIDERVNLVELRTSDILSRLAVIDCASLSSGARTGIYTLYLDHRGTHSLRCACNMETEGGGWTVILNRIHHEIIERATNFSRNMRDYKVGFGNPEEDFWAGLENIHMWTSFRDYQLRIQLEDFNGDTAFAHYDKFYIEDEKNGYRLHVSGYRGNAGDSLTNLDNPDNFTAVGMMFSSQDEDRDTSHEISCSQYWNIGGWWFNRCSWANLMGPYRLPQSGDGIGINWHKWRNKQYMKSASMMIRPSPS